MNSEALQHLLEAVATGEVQPTDALTKIKQLEIETVGDFARIDHHRQLRTGFPEVIWGQDKTPDQIIQIINAMEKRHPVVMATRIAPQVFEQLQAEIPHLSYYPMARIAALPPPLKPNYLPLNRAPSPF
jgi:NCAIR mutase (PurE)-related protein